MRSVERFMHQAGVMAAVDGALVDHGETVLLNRNLTLRMSAS